jgi:hypothetical protein
MSGLIHEPIASMSSTRLRTCATDPNGSWCAMRLRS